MKVKRKSKNKIIFPFIIAIYPALFIFSQNTNIVTFKNIIFLAAILAIGSLVIWLSLNFILKNKIKSSLVLSLIVWWFFFYGQFYNMQIIPKVGSIFIWRMRYVLIIWTLIFAFAIFVVIRTRKTFENLTKVLNFVSVFMIIWLILTIAYCYISNTKHAIPFEPLLVNEDRSLMQKKDCRTLIDPDIYYIILDSYNSQNSLKEFYKFDNVEFYSYLIDKGFYIPSQSFSNYPETYGSLASSLNMRHLEDLLKSYGKKQRVQEFKKEIMKNNALSIILKSKGYSYINIGFDNTYADQNYYYKYSNALFTDFILNEFILKEMTVISPLFRKFDILINTKEMKENVSFVFDSLLEVSKTRGKKFVFVHLLCPHQPFIFGENGETNTFLKSFQSDNKQLYLWQLVYLNKKLQYLIDQILLNSNSPPIIILQGDHGYAGGSYGFELHNKKLLKERYSIFCAIFLPDAQKRSVLYDSISPVNIFRYILNEYFCGDYKSVPDSSFHYYITEQNKLIDVTDRLKI